MRILRKVTSSGENNINFYKRTFELFSFKLTAFLIRSEVLLVLAFSCSSEKDFKSASDNFTNNDAKAGNYVINIFTSEDMENTPLGFWM